MAHMNSSLAYDLSDYELPQAEEKPKLKVVKSTSQRALSAALAPRTIASFCIVVTLLCLMVYNQVQLNEVAGAINTLNAQLDELDNENVKLNSELESISSLHTIGDLAENKLGMQRLDKYQTVYICLEQEDKVEFAESNPEMPLPKKIKHSFTSVIADLQEYIAD